jgi:hypothetical protein
MPIDTAHTDYVRLLPEWTKIENVCRFKDVQQYLVELNPSDKSKENKQRNEQYRRRAIFYAICQMTADGMVGSIFRKWPEFQAPDDLAYLKKNADGGGNSIYQLSQSACDEVLRKGRAGVAVTFPITDGEVKRQDIISGRYVATMHHYTAEEILNWRTEQYGAESRLVMVVTREQIDSAAGDYYINQKELVYREMYLDFERDAEGQAIGKERKIYRERVWRKAIDKSLYVESHHTPLDAAGRPWETIPFQFIGSRTNDVKVTEPPFAGLVELNVGHYRNSADYEDSVYFCGQAQPWMSGLTQSHIDMLNSEQMYVGSRNLLGVPSGETFAFAQAQPNTMVREAMDSKVIAMIQMGARLMQQGSATKTATQADQDQETTTSLLAMVASNVSEAYTQALEWVCRFMGADPTGAMYNLSQDFINLKANPQELAQIIAGFMSGAIPTGDYTRTMRRYGYFADDVTDEDYAELLARPSVE